MSCSHCIHLPLQSERSWCGARQNLHHTFSLPFFQVSEDSFPTIALSICDFYKGQADWIGIPVKWLSFVGKPLALKCMVDTTVTQIFLHFLCLCVFPWILAFLSIHPAGNKFFIFRSSKTISILIISLMSLLTWTWGCSVIWYKSHTLWSTSDLTLLEIIRYNWVTPAC